MTTLLAEPGREMPTAAGMRLPDFREDVPPRDLVALAVALDDVDVAGAASMDLLARAVGWERLISMAQARQAQVVGELVARREVGPGRTVDELQAALSCTAYQAQQMVVRAEGFAAHPALADALATGEIDLRRAEAVLHALPVTGDPHRWDRVLAAVLEDAPLWSAPALRRQTERLVLAADPEQARVRCERAQRERCVELHPDVAGMAWLSAYLPAPEAVAAFTVVDALAGSSRTVDDERTVDQRRADAFGAIFTAIASAGELPDGTPLPRKHGRRAQIHVTVAATTLLGLDDLPGELAGYGPITAETARRIAQDGTWRRLLTDPVSGTLVERGSTTYQPGADLTAAVIARDVTCTFPGCGQPAWRCELDHREPFDPDRPADAQTTAENLDPRCKHHHDLKGGGGWTVRRNAATGACEWTDPFGITFVRLAVPIAVTAAALRCIRAPSGEPPGPPVARGYPDEPPF